ncbi:hypothetical protein BC834DRAFT_970824 [Gloeopeniophorella convolvens]|nr:hypothetical protein BC834DRAFT_970824 [Gloeopeniophorella convolvens]
MFGFNQSTAPTRPQDPLINLPFNQWWFRGHLNYPPHPNDIMQLPVGGKVETEIACAKGVTSWWASAPGGDIRDPSNPDYPCPGQPTTQFHTNGINDLGGCALAVAYESDATKVKPEDLVVFSVNQTCVWTLHTDFHVPAQMPKCPNDKCTCAWFWQHKADSGAEQMYMTGFQCNMQGATSTTPLPRPKVPTRCGADPDNNVPANPANCTLGAKQPFYWYQAEGNNMHEGTYTPPLYTNLYHFLDGAQKDIFERDGDGAPPASVPPASAVSSAQVSSPSAPSSLSTSSSTSVHVNTSSVHTTSSRAIPVSSPVHSSSTTEHLGPTITISSTSEHLGPTITVSSTSEHLGPTITISSTSEHLGPTITDLRSPPRRPPNIWDPRSPPRRPPNTSPTISTLTSHAASNATPKPEPASPSDDEDDEDDDDLEECEEDEEPGAADTSSTVHASTAHTTHATSTSTSTSGPYKAPPPRHRGPRRRGARTGPPSESPRPRPPAIPQLTNPPPRAQADPDAAPARRAWGQHRRMLAGRHGF